MWSYPVLAGLSASYPDPQGRLPTCLLTRAPLYSMPRRTCFSYDLHVLSTPPAFVLSQIKLSSLTELSLTHRSAIQFSKIDRLIEAQPLCYQPTPLSESCQEKINGNFRFRLRGESPKSTPFRDSLSRVFLTLSRLLSLQQL